MPSPLPSTWLAPGSSLAGLEEARSLVDKFRAKSWPAYEGVSGRSVQQDLELQWSELHAYCAFLASTLEGSCRRIDQLGEEAKAEEQRKALLFERIRLLERRCEQRNVIALERQVASLQAELAATGAFEESATTPGKRSARVRDLRQGADGTAGERLRKSGDGAQPRRSDCRQRALIR